MTKSDMPEAQGAMRIYDVQVAAPDGTPIWRVMIAPGLDIEAARDEAIRRYGADVMRIAAVEC